MASVADRQSLRWLRSEPLRGSALVAAVLLVWLAGAFYCSGYERLASGLDNWPGSLIWSAAAVLPWLVLFEWSKSARGRALTSSPPRLALALVATAILSLALEIASDRIAGSASAPLALSLLRRLPAIGACLILILWSRAGLREAAKAEDSLVAIADSLDWVAAADNYVELHSGAGVTMRRMTLRDAERELASRGFVRIHRRFLVNSRRIAAVKGSNGDRVVKLEGGAELPIGRRYAANLVRSD